MDPGSYWRGIKKSVSTTHAGRAWHHSANAMGACLVTAVCTHTPSPGTEPELA